MNGKLRNREITIRQEKASDFHRIHEVVAAAFGQQEEALLIEALRLDPAYIPQLSLVALYGNEIVGQILFTKIKIVNGDHVYDSLSLAPVSVDPEHQKSGIGTTLIREGHQRAKDLGYTSVIVLGHADYYPRFGYMPASHWNIYCPFEVPDTAFMALELMPGSLNQVRGKVEYSAPFNSI